MMWHDGWGAGNWLVMGFVMLLLSGFIVGLAVWAARGHTAAPSDSNRGRQLLNGRFAPGEIDDDEHAQRRDNLTAR